MQVSKHSLPSTTFKGTQITFGGKVYTWNVAESKYKCDSDYWEIGGEELYLKF